MIRLLLSKKRTLAVIVLLLTIPMLATGQDQPGSVIYIDQGTPDRPMITYYHEIPGRFFIQRSPDVSQDYIISLLNELTDSPFESSWCSTGTQNDLCRVVIDDVLIDYLIEELLKDDGVLIARRIYVNKEFYDKYVAFLQQTDIDPGDYFKAPNLNNKETIFFNKILCYPLNQYRSDENISLIPKDSICNNLGIDLILTSAKRYYALIPKNVDVFEVSQKLLNTGYFVRVDINGAMPYSGMIFDDVYGTKVNKSDHFVLYDVDKCFFYEIPGRLFIEKSTDVTQDYINELLSNTINGVFETEWLYDDFCRVIVDDELIDNIINEMLKDDGVMTARRIYVSRNDYYKYLFYPDLEKGEKYFLNTFSYQYTGELNRALLDSISDSLGLTYSVGNHHDVVIRVPKQADIFEVSRILFETGNYDIVFPTQKIPPIVNHWGWGETYVNQTKKDDVMLEAVNYYNMLGHRVEYPSGLTIVVTRYSDGSVRTEKKLFR